jgi:formylglycine-generating enzyme
MEENIEFTQSDKQATKVSLLYRFFPLIGLVVAVTVVFCVRWIYPRYSLDRIPGEKEYNEYLQERSRNGEEIYKRNQEIEKKNPIKSRFTERVAGTVFPFIGIHGGCFLMGSADKGAYNNERPVHKVCVSSFYMGEHEVTQRQWHAIMEDYPRGDNRGDSYPVEWVRWTDVQQFIATLNQLTGKRYRLPTEAEWEYAARSGGKAEKWAGTNDKNALGEYAWFGQTLTLDINTRPVKQKKPNSLGLHDMTGNVSELCEDKYNYYIDTPLTLFNPLVVSGHATSRVKRGGGWQGLGVQNTFRAPIEEKEPTSDVGFRLVQDHTPILWEDRIAY